MVLKFSPESEYLQEYRATLTVREPTDPVAVDFTVNENPLSTNRVVMSGTVKWDGCVDISANYHACNIMQVMGFSKFMEDIYIRSGELLGEKADNDAFSVVDPI